MTEKTLVGEAMAVPQFGQEGKRASACARAILLNLYYCSRIDSSSETADQRVTRAKDGMFGSCATSSSMLIALAARTARLDFGSCNIVTESFTIFRMFLGVMFESAIC